MLRSVGLAGDPLRDSGWVRLSCWLLPNCTVASPMHSTSIVSGVTSNAAANFGSAFSNGDRNSLPWLNVPPSQNTQPTNATRLFSGAISTVTDFSFSGRDQRLSVLRAGVALFCGSDSDFSITFKSCREMTSRRWWARRR